jgi:hypothetical protein
MMEETEGSSSKSLHDVTLQTAAILLLTHSTISVSFHSEVTCFKHRSHFMQSDALLRVKLGLSIWEVQTKGVRTHRLKTEAVTQDWRKYSKGLRYLYYSPSSVTRLKQMWEEWNM